MLAFTFEIARDLFNSEETHPVKFEFVWQWLEYSRKDKGLHAFLACEFEENIDYLVFPNLGGNSEGRPSNNYRLSLDCFKHFSMMSKTESGRNVRKYFIECEKHLKSIYKKNEKYIIASQLIDNLTEGYKQLESISPVYVDIFVKSLNLKSENSIPDTAKLLDTTSLAANRLGLAFNKHIPCITLPT